MKMHSALLFRESGVPHGDMVSSKMNLLFSQTRGKALARTPNKVISSSGIPEFARVRTVVLATADLWASPRYVATCDGREKGRLLYQVIGKLNRIRYCRTCITCSTTSHKTWRRTQIGRSGMILITRGRIYHESADKVTRLNTQYVCTHLKKKVIILEGLLLMVTTTSW